MTRYQPKDRFHRRAKEEGFAARSVYKLEEIDARFELVKQGSKVVDLGCSPGSWLQYLAGAVGPTGVVLGYDLVEPRVSPAPQVRFRIADVHQLTPAEIERDLAAALGSDRAEGRAQVSLRIDALLSDMAPKTTGIRDADQSRSIGLVEAALALALALLKPNGAFAAKVFQGRGFDELLATIRQRFREVKALKPEATRQGSREAFLIARGVKPIE